MTALPRVRRSRTLNAVAIAVNGRGVGERRGLSVSGDRLEQLQPNRACLAGGQPLAFSPA
ncbi:hypothetical protein [Thiothrix unzii]|uniref:Uncharacterized protein n=1 Tax=Thiothrix unzii TaxID=111769 RepID=A0A975FCH6_9GAMM|nr:hypothetical protein [Thiothrix unzii]QTR55390.1 hypothetical protein J9260_17920 [Thiothrix unzii]